MFFKTVSGWWWGNTTLCVCTCVFVSKFEDADASGKEQERKGSVRREGEGQRGREGKRRI